MRTGGETATVTVAPRLEPNLVWMCGSLAAFGVAITIVGLVVGDGTEAPLAVVGGMAFVVAVLGVMGGRAAVETARQAVARSLDVIGVGAGPVVNVLPYWPANRAILHAELWPVDGSVPLGQVVLGQVGPAFDPLGPFRVWGPLELGAPVALTSVDGRQTVLPRSALEGAAPPGPPEAVTVVLTDLLRWPNRLRLDGGGDRAAAEAALAEVWAGFRRFNRRYGVLLVVTVVVTLALIVLMPAAVTAILLAGMVPMLAGMGWLASLWTPIDRLLPPWARADRRLRGQVRRALMSRRPAPSRWGGGDR